MRKATGTVAVVGAGITGLTAAAELQASGVECVLLERSGTLGGLCASRTVEGIVFDRGPHILFLNPNRKPGRYLLDLLKGTSLLRRRYRFAVLAAKRYWAMPAGPMEMIRYPFPELLAALRDLARCRTRRSSPASAADCIRKESGDRLYEELLAPLSLKKLGVSAEDLHPHWWTRPSKGLRGGCRTAPCRESYGLPSVMGKLLHDLRPFYCYPEKGIGTVAGLLASRHRGRTLMNCGVLGLNCRGSMITAVRTEDGSIPVDAVVWTAPPLDCCEALGIPCPHTPPVSSSRIIYAVLENGEKRQRPFLYTYHPERDAVFNRIYYPASITRGRTEARIEGLCFEVRNSRDIQAVAPKELALRVVEESRALGVHHGKLREYQHEVIDSASPLLQRDYLETEDLLFSQIELKRNLIFAGRQGNNCNCLIPGAVEQGLMAAEAAVCILRERKRT